MLFLVGEGDEFCFYRRAVAWTYALDLSVVEWGVGKSSSQCVVDILVGVARPAGQLLQHAVLSHKAELVKIGLSVLNLHKREIHRPPVYSHGSACLHPVASYAVACYALGEMFHSRLCYSSTCHHFSSYVEKSVEECASRNHHAACLYGHSPDGLYAHDGFVASVFFNQEFFRLVLPDVEVWCAVECLSPFPYKLFPVALCPWAPDCRSLASVEHSELYCRCVGHDAHLSAEGVDFAHYLSFGNTSHGRIAAHLCNLVHVHCHEASPCPYVSGSRCRLASCVARSDHNYVVIQCH